MYLRRYLEEPILQLSRSFPVVLITGARQVGKTTLLQHLGRAQDPPRNYVSLDQLGPQAAANEDPVLFLQRYPAPLIIDEVQQAPQLLAALKPVVDQSGAMGEYWLSGSQQFPLMREVSESLAGRVGIVELGGLSQAEEARAPRADLPFRPDRAKSEPAGPSTLLPIFERIVRGTFPRFVNPDPPPVDAFFGAYLSTYVERDVRSMLNIANLAAFRRFLRLAAARVGQLLNVSDLARDAGVAPSTTKEWLHLLEATYQVYLLRPYFENIGKRQIKTPKLYFRDPGLAAYLTGWSSAETAASGAMAGALFECYVVAELLKSYQHRGQEPPLWFYRTKEREEVDVVIAEDGKLFPIEIKLKATPKSSDLRGIRALEKTRAKLGAGAVVCMAEKGYPITEDVGATSVASIS